MGTKERQKEAYVLGCSKEASSVCRISKNYELSEFNKRRSQSDCEAEKWIKPVPPLIERLEGAWCKKSRENDPNSSEEDRRCMLQGE